LQNSENAGQGRWNIPSSSSGKMPFPEGH